MGKRNIDLNFRNGWDGSADIQDDLPSPLAQSVNLNFDEVWLAPSTTIEFGNPEASASQNIYPNAFDASAAGIAEARNKSVFVSPRGIFSAVAFGTTLIKNQRLYIIPLGIDAFGASNRTLIKNINQRVVAKGWDSAAFGWQVSYNLKQYLKPQGKDLSVYGKPALQGGVWYLKPYGFDGNKFGKIDALNTTASRELKPRGISSFAVGTLNVSPRILYPSSINELRFGTPFVDSPILKPAGFESSKTSNPTIWYHTRPLSPNGIDSFNTGFPTVFDPTQFIQQIPFEQTTVFGDTRTRNQSNFIKPFGYFDEAVSPWSTVTNSNRYYQIKGIDSQAIGQATVFNKTPSVFADGIDAAIKAGKPAIGYWVREVKPTGFNHLGLGRPLLTKTPELLPRGFDTVGMGDTTVWFKNRTVDLSDNAINDQEFGEATVWFRYRYIKPNGWQSSQFAAPTLTHGVREIIARGFLSERQSNSAWVSHGTRQLAPKSIYKDFETNHTVGRHQEIKPQGYEATLWGERIIPPIQQVLPQGFSNLWGNTTVTHYTRYIAPPSFISVGQQPADRWGAGKVYNSVQYITTLSPDNSELAPPKWSGWTGIENRNKTIGAVGQLSQKFGYAHAFNNATPLLPSGANPPPPPKPMISHAIRRLALEGIEPPPMSSWGVVYNDALVIGAQGFDTAAIGQGSVKNTRRTLRDIGRIESQEFGVPMIADRVRSIIIEPRHSIYPPYIQLPTVDLWTRYVSFNGFETAKYGLPALSIHFNIIAPKWVHSNRFGYPALKNLTPELLAYGHDSSDFGQAAIRTEWREIKAQGDRTELFGSATIGDTKQTIDVRGWRDGAVGEKLKVIKTGAPPYSEQKIVLQGFGVKVPDVNPRYLQVPEPALNQNVIAVDSEKPMTVFGETKIIFQSIHVDYGIYEFGFSNNARVELKDRRVELTEKHIIESMMAFGKPRMSPHTIYAPKEASPQAQENHPESIVDGRIPHYIDYWTNKGVGVALGHPKIDNQNRVLFAQGKDQSSISKPRVRLKNIIVDLKGNGITKGRFGVPSIPFTPQEIRSEKQSHDSLQVGSLSIITTNDVISSTGGIFDEKVSKCDIQLKIRNIRPTGLPSLSMGSSIRNDKPFMWQGLRVGERIPFIVGGIDANFFGNVFISHRIREINPIGFDSFVSEYDPDSFNQRMKVHRPRAPAPPAIRVTTKGVCTAQVSTFDIKHGQRFIRPDGNSDNFRKGGFA